MHGVKLVIGPSLALLAKDTLLTGNRVVVVFVSRVACARVTGSCVTDPHIKAARVTTRAPVIRPLTQVPVT